MTCPVSDLNLVPAECYVCCNYEYCKAPPLAPSCSDVPDQCRPSLLNPSGVDGNCVPYEACCDLMILPPRPPPALLLPPFPPAVPPLGDCPFDVNLIKFAWANWTQALYCPRGSRLDGHSNPFDFVCPEGTYCPDPATSIPCEDGTFCSTGTKASTPCRDGLLGTPAAIRCPEGMAYDPPMLDWLFVLLIALAPTYILVEVCSCLDVRGRGRRQRHTTYGSDSSESSSGGLQIHPAGRNGAMTGDRRDTSWWRPKLSSSVPALLRAFSRNDQKRVPRDERADAGHWLAGMMTGRQPRDARGLPSGADDGSGVAARGSLQHMYSNRPRCSSADSAAGGLMVGPVARGPDGLRLRLREGHSVGPSPPPSPPAPHTHGRTSSWRRRSASKSHTGDVSVDLRNPYAAGGMLSTADLQESLPSLLTGDAQTGIRGRVLLKLEVRSLDFRIGSAEVLSDISLTLQQGQLVALMGESGSGKTTLLNVLGGRAGYGFRKGEMRLNNRPFQPNKMKHLLGYVPQAHLVFKELTVYENLIYAAKLRLHKSIPAAQRAKLVEMAIDLLGLQQCRHFVCDPAIGERLSGGQMRRVGIGIELVCDAPIMLLDEPTSALDAVNTRLVVAALKSLAQRGVLVLASLHQPRFAVYEMLDRLILLRKGQLVYGGLREDALRYFEQLGYQLVGQNNPADFFIEVAFGYEDSDKRVKELPACFGLRPDREGICGPEYRGTRLMWNSSVQADMLGQLWTNWFKTSMRSVSRVMCILAMRQSDERRRALAILQYARLLMSRAHTKSQPATPRRKTNFENFVRLLSMSGQRSSSARAARPIRSDGEGSPVPPLSFARANAEHGRDVNEMTTPTASPGPRAPAACHTPPMASPQVAPMTDPRHGWTTGAAGRSYVVNVAEVNVEVASPDDTTHGVHEGAPLDLGAISPTSSVSASPARAMPTPPPSPPPGDVTIIASFESPTAPPADDSALEEVGSDVISRDDLLRTRSQTLGTEEAVVTSCSAFGPRPPPLADCAEDTHITRGMTTPVSKNRAGSSTHGTPRPSQARPSAVSSRPSQGRASVAEQILKTLSFRPRSRLQFNVSGISLGSSRTPSDDGEESPSSKYRVYQVGVSRTKFQEWFVSQEGFGTSIKPQLAEHIWERGAALATERARRGGIHRWEFNLASFANLFQGTVEEREVLPSWVQLREVMDNWPMPRGERPGAWTQFKVCVMRYVYKMLRTRVRVYILVVVTGLLGTLCGVLHGVNPPRNDVLIFYLLFNTMFGSICSTSLIGSFGGNVEFFSHEAASGVRQGAEGLARMLIDLFTVALLVPVFTLPLYSFASLQVDLFVTWLLFSWAMSPLGYIFTLVAPGNATVLTSSITFVLCAFANGFFGVKASFLPDYARWIMLFSPGTGSFQLVAFGAAVARPFDTQRWALIRQLLYAGLVPEGQDPYYGPWENRCFMALAIFGGVLRITALIIFFLRSTFVLQGTLTHFRLTAVKKLYRCVRSLRNACCSRNPPQPLQPSSTQHSAGMMDQSSAHASVQSSITLGAPRSSSQWPSAADVSDEVRGKQPRALHSRAQLRRLTESRGNEEATVSSIRPPRVSASAADDDNSSDSEEYPRTSHATPQRRYSDVI